MMDVGAVNHGRAAFEPVAARETHARAAQPVETSEPVARDERAAPSRAPTVQHRALGEPGREREPTVERAAPRSGPGPVIAARVGLAPLVQPVDASQASDDLLRASLRERARLLDLTPVLSQPEGKADVDHAPPLLGEEGPDHEPTPLLGAADSREPDAMPPPRGEAHAENTSETDAPRRPFRGEPPLLGARERGRGSSADTALVDDERTEAPPAAPSEPALVYAAALAPPSIALREPADARGKRETDSVALGGNAEHAPLREAQARAHFSQSGAVEADSPDDLVPRFADPVQGMGKGPMPRSEP
jgi:hypothetical protein